jgi:hypothetical protein
MFETSKRAFQAAAAVVALTAFNACAPADNINPNGMGTGGSSGTAGSGGGGSMASGGSAGTGGTPSGDAGDAGMPDGGKTTLLDNPVGDLPQDLVDVGIYTAIPSLTMTDPRAFYYEPKHALWSNGLDKSRFMILPKGAKIDTSVRDAWNFPVGTLFVKTFSYRDAMGKVIPIETRLIRRVSDTGEVFEQWTFDVYEWNAQATGAKLIDIKLRTARQAIVDGKTITHNIPKLADCWNCHIANKTPIIGFDELRLNSTLQGQTQVQLDKVIAGGWLSAAPVKPWAAITDPNPLQQQVFQYIQGNCVHCHNGEERLEPGARYPALDLHPDKILKNTVNVMTMTVGTASGYRIVPGDPMKSILFLGVSRQGSTEVKPMPLVGVDVVDAKAVEMLRQWITALKP